MVGIYQASSKVAIGDSYYKDFGLAKKENREHCVSSGNVIPTLVCYRVSFLRTTRRSSVTHVYGFSGSTSSRDDGAPSSTKKPEKLAAPKGFDRVASGDVYDTVSIGPVFY